MDLRRGAPCLHLLLTPTFINRDTSLPIAIVPVGLVSLTDTRTGTATLAWAVNIRSANSPSFTITIRLTHTPVGRFRGVVSRFAAGTVFEYVTGRIRHLHFPQVAGHQPLRLADP
jgi:hypothetical protein